MKPHNLYSIQDLASILNVSLSTVYRWIREKKLTTINYEGSNKIDPVANSAFLSKKFKDRKPKQKPWTPKEIEDYGEWLKCAPVSGHRHSEVS